MSLSKALRSSVLYISADKSRLIRGWTLGNARFLGAEPIQRTISQYQRKGEWPGGRQSWAMAATAAAAALVLGLNVYLYSESEKGGRLSDLVADLTKGSALHAKETNEFKDDRAIVITSRQRLFFQFASIEFEGIPYMTPQDFIESVTEDHPRPRMRRKIMTRENYQSYLKYTPPLSKGSSRFFRNLEERGLISYSEYLFLLCVLTKPRSSFEIAFNMFDTDGNQRVDKKEFLVVTKIFQRNSEEMGNDAKESNDVLIETDKKKSGIIVIDPVKHIDTTLLVHLFGKAGANVLTFDQFKKFMEDLQREILEIEFNEFSKGMNKISCMDFAEIMLRYTSFDQSKRMTLLKRLPTKLDAYSREISFDKFLQFNAFMNNLADFSLALKFHTMANRPISVDEFQRAVKISSGFELDAQIVQVIFAVFDQDGDGQLSYKEFIAVLKDRLRRGQKVTGRRLFETAYGSNLYGDNLGINDTHVPWYSAQEARGAGDDDSSLTGRFKRCIRGKLRERYN